MELELKSKKFTKLIIQKKYFLIRQKIRIFVKTHDPIEYGHHFQIPILRAKAKDSLGPLKVNKINNSSLLIYISRNLRPNTIYTFDVSILINPKKFQVGGIIIINWGILDISQIISYIPLYQVLVFAKYQNLEKKTKYTNNLSSGLTSHLSRFRNGRIEIGKQVRVRINLTINLDCSNCSIGSKINEISVIGPTQIDNQKVKLVTKNVVITKDKNANPRYVQKNIIIKNKRIKIQYTWDVIKLKPNNLTNKLGSIHFLTNLKRKSKLIKNSITGNRKNWNIWHPIIKKIIHKTQSMENIYDIHKYLFEFTNRRLHYKENEIRYPAIKALMSKFGDCSEYSDLLVTLHRASGIPSKVIEGIILEEGGLVSNHSWLKFYTSGGWISCDPTWGLELGTTSQHIEFGSQIFYDETKMIELKVNGATPKINYQMNWSNI